MRVSRGCRVDAAEALVEQKKSTEWWFTCQTCEQRFTGEMRGGLANEWWSRVCDRAEDDGERLSSAGNLANSLLLQGKLAEAEKMEREVLAVKTRVLGAEHLGMLATAGNLAASLSRQGKHAQAEKMQREVLAVRTRVLEADHPDTLTAAGAPTTGAPTTGSLASLQGSLCARPRCVWQGCACCCS